VATNKHIKSISTIYRRNTKAMYKKKFCERYPISAATDSGQTRQRNK